jgi:hypothetical protein
MKAFLRKLKAFLRTELDRNKKYSLYKKQLNSFKQQLIVPTTITEYLCLDDATPITYIEPHYTYHPAWAARVLAQTKPAKHIDISSITHFSNIVSAFIPVEFYDYRPANIVLSTCMHTVEHIGLGRYGDPIDAEGDKKAMKELERVLAVNGTLLFVVPIGTPRIEFNAHRIYNYDTIINNFCGLQLKEFSLIPDDFEQTGYVTNPSMELINKQIWGCGCFWFTKI